MNLRPTSSPQKGGPKRGNSEYRGIRFRKDRWISEIRVSGTPDRIWLGSHLSAEKAARAYDAAVYCLKGEKGIFNFPNNARPDLGNRRIGSIKYTEIQRIAQKFASLVEDSVDTPISPPAREISPSPGLTPPREFPQVVQSPLELNKETSIQSCKNKIDISEEPVPYIPRFAPEDPPYDPTFVPDEEYISEQFLELDQWGILDGDWMRYTKNLLKRI